jgi:hypothetical protein
MRRFRFAVACVAFLLAAGFAADAHAARFWCRGPYAAPAFGFGGFGSSVGYGAAVSRVGWGGWCGPRWGGWCGPTWNGCGPGWGWGYRAWGSGYGPWGCGPWYGGGLWGFRDSVYLSVPGATFFSGSLVPVPACPPPIWGYPATWVPGPYGWYGYPYGTPLPSGFAPQYGPAGVLPFLGLGASTANPRAGTIVARAAVTPPARPVVAAAAAGRPVVFRASTGIARLRAARLVAVGDRHLRAAQGDPARLTAALDAYRRAGAIAQDQADIQLRQALVLVALDRQSQADEAVGRAVAVDGRLAPPPAPPAAGGPALAAADPVFGDRPAVGLSPFAARGAAILREIAGQGDGDAGRAVAPLADRWAQRFDRGRGAIAATSAVAR